MEIKVLGSGCTNCKKLLQHVETAVKELEVKADVKYVTDMIEIANTGLLRTPGLIINDQIVSFGRVPSVNEVIELIERKK